MICCKYIAYIEYINNMITYEKYVCSELSTLKYKDGLREYGETDNCLNKCLEKLFPNNVFLHNKFIKYNNEFILNYFGQKICPDYICEELKMIIEFDGDSGKNGHYTDPFTILKDNINSKILSEYGYSVIRIPFYLQLNKEAIKYLFDIEFNGELYESINDHGFKHPMCILPSQFCECGVDRFINEISHLPISIKNVIIESLKYRMRYYNDILNINYDELVISQKLKSLL